MGEISKCWGDPHVPHTDGKPVEGHIVLVKVQHELGGLHVAETVEMHDEDWVYTVEEDSY